MGRGHALWLRLEMEMIGWARVSGDDRAVMGAAEILSDLREEVTVVLTWKTRAIAGLPSSSSEIIKHRLTYSLKRLLLKKYWISDLLDDGLIMKTNDVTLNQTTFFGWNTSCFLNNAFNEKYIKNILSISWHFFCTSYLCLKKKTPKTSYFLCFGQVNWKIPSWNLTDR